MKHAVEDEQRSSNVEEERKLLISNRWYQRDTKMSQLSGSFSMHSLVEGSEAISEAEEIQEVKHLQCRGDSAFHGKHFTEALRCYNDALEIDERNLSALLSRAAVYVEMGNYVLAQQDAEKVVLLSPNNSQAHYLLGMAHHRQGQYRESLQAYLNALELETQPDHTDLLANNIATLAHHFCHLPEKLVENLPEMDSYKKLCEVGACLYQSRCHDESVKVLMVAQKVATNQKGITMKVLLTLANAHSALKHTNAAISYYQECLSTAVSTHDYQYQTKALISIASLFLDSGDTHRAIVHYKRLLDLEKEIQGEDPSAPLPSYWTTDLQCALQLNLSIAYKTIGSIEQATHHAKIYSRLSKGNEHSGPAHSYHNAGTLHEILGEHTEALANYQNYLKQCKEKGDPCGVAQAYGCLGGAYAFLNNRSMALAYHEQSIVIAKSLSNQRVLAQSYEQFGDTHFRFKDYCSAIECYMQVVRSCTRNDLRMQMTALCRIGAAYRAQERHQYSIYYFEQAKMISEDFDYDNIETLCEYNLACSLQHSSQILEVDQAKKYFEKLIPVYEDQIKKHEEEDTFCPSEIKTQLDDCYIGLINILGKTGYKEEALVYSEAFHQKLLRQLLHASVQKSQSSLNLSVNGIFDMWSIERLKRVVNEQNATVLYYVMLPSRLLLWVLQPGEGIVRFYMAKQSNPDETVGDHLTTLIENLLKDKHTADLVYDCENRALPDKGTDLKITHTRNKDTGGPGADATNVSFKIGAKEGNGVVSMETRGSAIKGVEKPEKSAERQLFDYLIAPVDDILSQLEDKNPLVIIPDKALYNCPFGSIQDWNGVELQDRFRITYLPSLYLLDNVTKSELAQLKLQDEVSFDRGQSRMGGMPKVLMATAGNVTKPQPIEFASQVPLTTAATSCTEHSHVLDTRKVSNPRLAKSGTLNSNPTAPIRSAAPVVSRRTSGPTSKSWQNPTEKNRSSPPVTVPVKSVDSPTPLCKMVSLHTLSTLVSKTSTNTDVITAACQVTEYRQVSNKEKGFVFGNPKLPEILQLHGKEWKPRKELTIAQNECFKVAEILGVNAVVGEGATKDRFLADIQHATIIHIATMACLTEGLLVTSPNPKRHEQGAPLEQSYLVTCSEIATTPMVAKLVVLSTGWSTYSWHRDAHTLTILAEAFLTAGAQCVLQLLWPIPNAALDKFYFNFYQAFTEGATITCAVNTATNHLKEDPRYNSVSVWGTFVVFGKDVSFHLGHIKRSMLDQTIDQVETEVQSELDYAVLNPTPVTPNVASLEENLTSLQKYVGELLIQHQQRPEIVPHLITLLDGALKRLHMEDNNRKTLQLPGCISETEASLKLLKLLGFHFQGRGSSLVEPYVVCPHWNHNSLLVPSYEALCAVCDIITSMACARALYELLPTTDETLSNMVDVLCITKHAPEIQLKVSDMSVRPLWKNPKVKAVVMAIGFHQIGPLLNFRNIPSNRKLLNAALQLLISFSAYKSPTLMHKLDVTLLGGPNSATKSSDITFERVRLPSLVPVVLPRNQLRLSSPWMSTVEHPLEMEEKIKLAQSKSDLDTVYRQHLKRAKTWHQVAVSAQAEESLDTIGRPQTVPNKVKVKPGSTASCQRHLVDAQSMLGIHTIDQRRDYAHFVLNQRLDTLSLHHRDSVRKSYLPYIENI